MKEFTEKYMSRRQCLILFPFAVIYALCMVWTRWDSLSALNGGQGFLKVLLWTVVSYVILLVLCVGIAVLQNVIPAGKQCMRQGKWYLYAIFFAVCFACWLPYFLIYFPGWISNDSVWQLEQVCGWVPGSNHHPYAHTMIIKVFFMLGYRLFGTYTGACAVYTVAQMLVMAGIYAYLLCWLYRKGTSLVGIVLALIFYAVLPMNGIYAICMGKDVLFSGALLLYAWMGSRLAIALVKREEIRTSEVIWYACFGVAVCLLRSNGIFVFLGTSCIMGILCLVYRNWKKMLPAMGIALLCYVVWQGPVLSALEVEKGDTIEGLTMPTQHILNAYLNGGTLTQEELELLNEVIPMDTVASYHNPYYFDIVKNYIREAGNQEVIAGNKGAFFKLWLQVGLRNPKQYLEAEIKQTQGYFASKTEDYQYLYEQYLMAENPFEMTTQRKVFSYDFGLEVDAFLLKFQDFYNKVWSLGKSTWLLFFAFAYAAYRKKNVMLFVPYVMVLLSLLLATPVHAEFRYAYGIFVALPILLCVSFGKEKEV
ncbi:MAG: DUF6020 family protein [Lachnospiraceae bacterium]|nr:DUF6020 family protein [Lachnospiraceae bacterium]